MKTLQEVIDEYTADMPNETPEQQADIRNFTANFSVGWLEKDNENLRKEIAKLRAYIAELDKLK